MKKQNKPAKIISIKPLFNWLDNNILLLLSCFLLIFIPLYPKIPLAELIPGYIVRMRLEDIFVLFTTFVWAVQVLRKKIRYYSIIHLLILIYLLVSVFSLISAVVVTQTIIFEPIHLGKSLLHWVRYLEYFMLFAISYSAIKSFKEVKIMLGSMITALIGVIIYGYGQKFHYWPVFSTMNREFSKGIRLYLTEHARVQSTFGGHYDFAAYLVILNTLVLSFALTTKNKLHKTLLHIIHLFGLWMLILTASRVSFFAYYAAMMVVIILFSTTQQKLLTKIYYAFSRSIIFSFMVGVMMISFGQDMRDRLFHVVKEYPQVEQSYLVIEEFVQGGYRDTISFLSLSRKKPDGEWVAVDISDQQITVDPVLDKTDQRPSTTRPDDVYVDVPDKVMVATQSATGETEYLIVERERTWSDNAIKYGLSAAIRLDTLWPNAIKGFSTNPLLGTGFATLNKETRHHFTEAESTDNNFLRTLGETGLLGFVSFYGAIATAVYLSAQLLKSSLQIKKFHQKQFLIGISVGYIALTVGLLINSVYIDIYASSKVAFTYWALTGLIVALCHQQKLCSKLSSFKDIKNCFVKKTSKK